MKIVWISETLLPSGSAHAVFTLEMVSALAECRHDVVVVAPWHEGRARDLTKVWGDFALSGVFPRRHIPLGQSRRVYGRVAPLVSMLFRPDLMMASDATIAARAAMLGARVVVKSHAHFPPESVRLRRAAQSLSQLSAVRAWAFCSQRLLDIVAEEVPLLRQRCLVAHNGHGPAQYRESLSPQEARRRLGLPVERQHVVHSGHLYQGRGAEETVSIASSFPDVELLFVGGTDRDVRPLAGAVPPNVKLLGHQPPSRVPLCLGARRSRLPAAPGARR